MFVLLQCKKFNFFKKNSLHDIKPDYEELYKSRALGFRVVK